MRNSTPKPPKHLSAEARKQWAAIVAEYSLDDDAGLLILTTSLEAFDRMRQAQKQIESDGATTLDRFGQLKAHPLLPVERDSRAAFMAGLKALNLDLEPLHDRPGRPSGSAKVGYPFARAS